MVRKLSVLAKSSEQPDLAVAQTTTVAGGGAFTLVAESDGTSLYGWGDNVYVALANLNS